MTVGGAPLRAFAGLPARHGDHALGSALGPRQQARGLVCRHFFNSQIPQGIRPPMRPRTDNYAKWDYQNRQRTNSYEEAEMILMNTGKMPRPLRLCDVKLSGMPMKRSIVANAKERRKIAEWMGMYAITRLQAKLLLKRDQHTVWGHERVLVYGKLLVQYLQPDANTNDPMEMEHGLKFKAAFRENDDPDLPTRERRWNDHLEEQGLMTDVIEGKSIKDAIKGLKPTNEIPENMFCEAILDNVVDLGELVLQHFVCHLDKQVTSNSQKSSRLQKRMQKRLSKEMGVKAQLDLKEENDEPEGWIPATAQQVHDTASKFNEWNRRKFRLGG